LFLKTNVKTDHLIHDHRSSDGIRLWATVPRNQHPTIPTKQIWNGAKLYFPRYDITWRGPTTSI